MILILIAVLGLALGSFIDAVVWRLHAQSQATSKKNKAQLSISRGRSMCDACGHALSWVDLIPVISWVQLRGRCRYCKKSVSIQHPLVEMFTAGLLVGSFALWPYELVSWHSYLLFTVWAAVLLVGIALVLYDLAWMILPNKLVYPFNGLAAVFLAVTVYSAHSWSSFANGLIGAVVFSGFFYMLYQLSGGKWIGGGDVRLAVGLGLLLGWQKSILALMLAAYLGTAVIVILLLIKKYHRKMKLPFGPFLLAGTYTALLFGQQLIDWYRQISGL